MIRIDEIRALHYDLHMRPFEGDRRVYLILDAHRMNDDAAAALLKDLEEPPAYATLVLVADELGSLPETIRSRCQLVPFRRLSRSAVEAWLTARQPELPASQVATLARVAGGRLDRAARLLDDAARAQRAELIAAARGAYLAEASIRPTQRPSCSRGLGARERGARARAAAGRGPRPPGPRGGAARQARRLRRRAGRDPRVARRSRRVVPRPRARRRRRRGGRRQRRPARRPALGRRGRRRPGRGGGGDRRASGLARGGGVQPQRDAAARSALRPPPRAFSGAPSAAR